MDKSNYSIRLIAFHYHLRSFLLFVLNLGMHVSVESEEEAGETIFWIWTAVSISTTNCYVSIADLRKTLRYFINVAKKLLQNDGVSINQCYASKIIFFPSRDKSW